MTASPSERGSAPLDTFPRLLLNHAATRGDRPATREKYLGIWQTWNWSQVTEEVRAIACGLAELGFKRGDNLALIGDNRPHLYMSDGALCKCVGGVPMPHVPGRGRRGDDLRDHRRTRGAASSIAENQEQVDKLLEMQASRCPASSRTFIYDDATWPAQLRARPGLHQHLDEADGAGQAE
jgi:long-chain acyl-CoA synthetase